MPRPKKHQAQNTRELALAAAEGLLRQHGYLGVSMDDVAAASGVRKASLYHHFPEGKEELVTEVALRALAAHEQGMLGAITSRRSATEQLEAIADWRFRQPPNTEPTLREAARHLHPARQKRVWEGFTQHLLAHVEGIFRSGIAGGEFRDHDPRFTAWAFLALVSEFTEVARQYPQPDLSRNLVSLIVDGLRP